MKETLQSLPNWYCPQCDRESPFTLHNARVTRQKNIALKPILPTYLVCGAEVLVPPPPALLRERKLIVLNGTCASGKSSTAEVLVARHGFAGIDGNCVMDVVRYKLGTKNVEFNGMEMLQEIGQELNILLALQQDIVLAQVIMPDDLPAYREIFCRRSLRYKIFVLQPCYATAVARSQARTCFKNTTPEIWVKHFYDALSACEAQEDVVLIDNSEESVEESAERIVRLYHREYSGSWKD